MSKRLYFLVTEEAAAKAVTDSLRARGLEDDRIFAVAKRDKYLLERDIPDAGLLQTSNAINAAKRGAVIGGIAGVFAGLTAMTIVSTGLIAAGGAVAALGAAGAAAGTWTSSMIGVSVPNWDLKAFQEAVDQGQILLLTDVPDNSAEAVRAEILEAHAETVVNDGVLAA
jgi:hypothetical protein